MKPSFLLFLALAGSALADHTETRPAPPAFEKGTQDSVFDESDPQLPRQIQVTVEFIEVPQAEASRLLYKEKLGKDGEKLRTELQKLVDETKASVFETLMVTSRSGQKATSESIREVIYPTEYEPAQIPDQVTVDKETAASVEKLKILRELMTPPVPTAFTTRNVGNTLEVEPTLAEDNHTIDLKFVPELVFEAGMSTYQESKDALGNEAKIQMPLFYTMRLNTALALSDGLSQLAGVMSPKTADGVLDPSRKVFVIVRADVVTVKPRR